MRYTFLSRDREGVPMARGGPPKQMKVCVARIRSSDGDFAPSPSYTTGRAVFRLRRLNAAVYCSARLDGIRKL